MMKNLTKFRSMNFLQGVSYQISWMKNAKWLKLWDCRMDAASGTWLLLQADTIFVHHSVYICICKAANFMFCDVTCVYTMS